ncbi:MAG: hypothetical protein M5R36_22455 [Deltaproteobacteria bacterium]|nr:hypothetical protein [Deltaproteobacteria bacterium]
MLESALAPVARMAAVYWSVVNAVHIGALKKIGILEDGVLRFSEVLASPAARFELLAEQNLMGLFDPTNEEQFLTWKISPGSRITVDGLCRDAAVDEGHLKLVPFKYVEYRFDFSSGGNGPWNFLGLKNLKSWHQVAAWSTLRGDVHDAAGGKVARCEVFSGEQPALASLRPFLASLRIR